MKSPSSLFRVRIPTLQYLDAIHFAPWKLANKCRLCGIEPDCTVSIGANHIHHGGSFLDRLDGVFRGARLCGIWLVRPPPTERPAANGQDDREDSGRDQQYWLPCG